MDAESASDTESLDTTCPFLAQSTASGIPICLARGEDVIGISSRYVAAYCSTARHVECSRFIQADRAVTDHPVEGPSADETVYVDRSLGGGSLGATGDKPPIIEEAPPEAVSARSPKVSEPVDQIQRTPAVPRPVIVAAANHAQSGRAVIQRPREAGESPLSTPTGSRLDALRAELPGLGTIDRRLALLAGGAFLVIAALVILALSQRSSGSRPNLASVGGQHGTSPRATVEKPTAVLPAIPPTAHATATPYSTVTARPTPTAGPRPTVRPAVVPRPKPAVSSTATLQPTTTQRPGPTAASRPKPAAVPRPKSAAMHRPTPTATPVKRSEPAATPVLPAPAVAWHFPTLHQPADKVILTLDNPNNVAATVQVRIIVKTATTVKRFLIPAASGTEVDLGTPAVSASLSLLATAPIVPQRLVIHHNSVRSSRGQPGA